MKRTKLFSALCLMFSIVMLMTAIVAAEQEEAPVLKEGAPAVELADWDGNFVSMGNFIDDEEVVAAIDEMAEAQGKDAADIKAELEEQYVLPFAAVNVDGDKISFLDKDGEAVDESTYEYKDTYVGKFGTYEFEWYQFNATNEGSKYPVLLMMPVHGEETLAHFHVRYGDDIDTLINKGGWYPTLVRESATGEQIAMAIKAHSGSDSDDDKDDKKDKVEMPDAEVLDDIDLSEWEGDWNNMGAYLKDEGLKDAFATLAERENMEVVDARVAYKLKRFCEFDGFKVEGDTISFCDGFPGEDNTDVLAKNEYKYKETYKVKHGNFDLEWHVFVTEDEGARYPVLMLMPVHGEEVLIHFHMRYGNSVEELMGKDSWYPTFVKPATTIEQLVEEITE